MRIRSFQGLRPVPELAAQVASVPYDVVNTEEAAKLAEGNPHSMLRIIRPEIELPRDTDVHSAPVYAQGVANLKKFQDNGTFLREPSPCLYLYRQIRQGKAQRGLAALCHVEDYDLDIIKKHEKTRPDKEDDRTRTTSELNANPEPVFLTYEDVPSLTTAADLIEKSKPLYDFTADDGVQHTLWRIADTQPWVEGFARVPVCYVADGHHRSASAARVGRERRLNNPRHTGNENYNWFLCVLFPASELTVLPYNRVVLDLNGLDDAGLLAKVKTVFRVTENAPPQPAASRHVSMYLGGAWYGLSWDEDIQADPVSRLDVSVLQDRLLQPVLGIDDPRTSQRIEFVGGIRGVEALQKAVDTGKAAVAFSMHPVTVGQLMAIADAGQIMPPKSTWFEPKLRSGLFIHTLD